MESIDLLPASASSFMRTASAAGDSLVRLDAGITALHGMKILNPPPSFLPYLVYEYGLGELTPYVPNLYELIDEGIDWQRVRGSPAAVAMGLGWLGYAGMIEEAPTRRRFWNIWHILLDRLRDSEADLIRIEGVASLSDCQRSDFWRGFRGYDVRALEYGWSTYGNCFYGDDSGVRLQDGNAKWSFGRSFEQTHDMTEAELTALGIWLEPVGGEPLKWGPFPWGPYAWADSAALVRSATMLAAAGDGPAWAVFYDADAEIIGYRRCRIRRAVAPAASGPYAIGANRYDLAAGAATRLYVEALTGFGDGYGHVAASVGFILSAEPLAPNKTGALWLPAGGLDPGLPVVALNDVSIEFGRTVRERIAAILRF
jgi:hypothetical protein